MKTTADRAEIIRALSLLFADDDVIELRALHKGRKRTDAGYFDAHHRDALADAAVKLNGQRAAVYINLNPLDPQLLGRYANRVEDYASATATDANVTRRRWMLIDLDPVRPKDTSATEAQKEAAKQRARAVFKALRNRGWPDPIVADSGNGMHLLYGIDLPNDDASRDLIKGVLAELARQFDDAEVTVDQSVFNAARICKLYGTVSNKGDHTEAAPWRVSRIVSVPDPVQVVPMERLRELLPASAPTPKPPAKMPASGGTFDLGDFLRRLGIDHEQDRHEGRDRYRLAHCPFNADHGRGESAIFRSADGKLGFKCQHNSCADRTWQDVRALVDGPRNRDRGTGTVLVAPGGQFVVDQGEQPDPHRNAPQPDPACLYGLVGDVASAASSTTEANPYAAAMNFLAYLGAAVGRGCYMPVGNTWHHARLFTLHIGRSARGRKGDAVALIDRIDRRLRDRQPFLAPLLHSGGLSTREGLVLMIHDSYKKGEKEEVPGIDDKRLWVVESEFSNVLHQSRRDGNTLSAALRDAWDGRSIRPATKTQPIGVTDPHISLSAAITPTELRDLLARRELTNGFANRFLMIWAERQRMMPFPMPTPQGEVEALTDRLIEVLKFAGADRPVDRDVHAMGLTGAAQARYANLYRHELNRDVGSPLVTTLLERRAPMLLRLAMLFALCDLNLEVDVRHIDAALAWIRYWSDSVRFVFSNAEDEVRAAETSEAARRILAFLAQRQRVTRTDITRECFGGHSTKEQIDAALDELLTTTPPTIVITEVPRPKGSPGLATKFYSPAANSAKSANCEDSCGFAGDSPPANSGETSEISSTSFRTFRTVRGPADPSESRASAHISHTSHVSHGVTEISPTAEVF